MSDKNTPRSIYGEGKRTTHIIYYRVDGVQYKETIDLDVANGNFGRSKMIEEKYVRNIIAPQPVFDWRAMNNEEKLMKSNKPIAYAKRILKNSFIDNYRKEKRMVSIEANNIPVMNDGFQEQSAVCQEMLKCLEGFDEPDKTILIMLGLGNSYEEIHEVIGDISMGNLRVKANRARQDLANCMGKKS